MLSMDRSKIVTHQFCGEPMYINGISYVVADDNGNRELVEKEFTPSNLEEFSELDIKASVVGNGAAQDINGAKPKKSVFNSFTSVDIIDASDGTADVAAVKEELKSYGYNVMNITNAKDTVYERTVVVAASRGVFAGRVAAIMGLDEYIHNSHKKEGSDVTVVLGKE